MSVLPLATIKETFVPVWLRKEGTRRGRVRQAEEALEGKRRKGEGERRVKVKQEEEMEGKGRGEDGRDTRGKG